MREKGEWTMAEYNNISFSVLMSIYHGGDAKSLDQSIKSLAEQTVLPTDFVLVEDGPLTPSLIKVIEKWQQNFPRPLRIFKLKHNHGLGVALSIGSRHIKSDWIARMDADDICRPQRFESQLNYIRQHPEVAVIGGQIKEFTKDPRALKRSRQVPTSNREILQFIKWRCPFNHPTVMINRQRLNEVGGYLPFGTWKDYYLWARFAVKGYAMANLDQTLVLMRVDKDLYHRRGKTNNLKYVMKLQKYMYQHGLMNRFELITGDILNIDNIIIPVTLRRFLYQNLLRS